MLSAIPVVGVCAELGHECDRAELVDLECGADLGLRGFELDDLDPVAFRDCVGCGYNCCVHSIILKWMIIELD